MTVAKIRTVFAGTPEFAVPSLRVVLARPELEVVAVYTQPDRPAGRGRKLAASPIKMLAETAGLPLEQPVRVTTDEALAQFAALAPDLLIVAAYGLLLPSAFIEPPITAINVHASLLPRWRGAAPIQRAVMAGDTVTGISIMRVVKRLDAGPVWLRHSCPIAATDTGGSLHDRLAALGADALDMAITLFMNGTVVEEVQDETLVTYAAKLDAADRVIDWTADAAQIALTIRALAPSPAATARVGGLEVKVLRGEATDSRSGPGPGTVLAHGAAGIVIATGTTDFVIHELQPAGKQRMSAQAFSNGYGHLL